MTVLKIADKTLQTANMGDSGYALFHVNDNKLELYFRSEEQQKEFNYPVQIGSVGDPPSMAV